MGMAICVPSPMFSFNSDSNKKRRLKQSCFHAPLRKPSKHRDSHVITGKVQAVRWSLELFCPSLFTEVNSKEARCQSLEQTMTLTTGPFCRGKEKKHNSCGTKLPSKKSKHEIQRIMCVPFRLAGRRVEQQLPALTFFTWNSQQTRCWEKSKEGFTSPPTSLYAVCSPTQANGYRRIKQISWVTPFSLFFHELQ